jgi:hypothetical protein
MGGKSPPLFLYKKMVVTMKYTITIFLFITLFLNLLFAGGIKGSFSTGVFMGSPFWNADNYKDDNKIDYF